MCDPVPNNTLLEKYDRWVADMRSAGRPLLSFKPACCGKETFSRRPHEGEVWDSLATCPHCGAMYMKVSFHDHIEARFLEGE